MATSPQLTQLQEVAYTTCQRKENPQPGSPSTPGSPPTRSFDPIWEVLHPHEQRALLALLFERVEYHAESDDLELVLRDTEVPA